LILFLVNQESVNGSTYCYSCSDLVATVVPADATLKSQIESGAEARCSYAGDAFLADPPSTTLCQPYDSTYDAFCMKSNTTTQGTYGATYLEVVGVERSCLVVPKNLSLTVGCQAPPQYMTDSLASSGFGNLSIAGTVCLCDTNLCNVYGASSTTTNAPTPAPCNNNGGGNTVIGTQPAWGIRNACALANCSHLFLVSLLLLFLSI